MLFIVATTLSLVYYEILVREQSIKLQSDIRHFPTISSGRMSERKSIWSDKMSEQLYTCTTVCKNCTCAYIDLRSTILQQSGEKSQKIKCYGWVWDTCIPCPSQKHPSHYQLLQQLDECIDVERSLGLCSKISSARILHRLIITRSNYKTFG